MLPQITTVNTSMFDMDFADESFDLIWSEGAIYIAGFAEGLAGVEAVPEAGRMAGGIRTDVAGAESAGRGGRILGAMAIRGMGSIERNCQIVAEAGYVNMDGFVCSVKDWWTTITSPTERRVEELQEKYAGDREAFATLDDAQREYDLFRVHHDAYGYVFYVMRKPPA